MNNIVIKINKKYFIEKYGKKFYNHFKNKVNKKLKEIIPDVPDIGDSIFKSSYLMAIFFIAWFKVLKEMNISSNEANLIIWEATENCLKKIPSIMIPLAKKMYLTPMIKKAESHSKKSKNNSLPEYDWKIEYIKVDDNIFCLNTYECGIKKLCKKFETEEMLPSLCRMDYLTSHYLKSGFERTKTLGDGDEICNNKFYIDGECEWNPEKGFVIRK
jgi:hypothetical protein